MGKQQNRFVIQFNISAHRCIRLNWLLVILLVAGEYVFVNLGLWQLSRADEKSQLLEQANNQQKYQAVSLLNNKNELIEVTDYQPIMFDGAHYAETQVYLANEPFKGQDGYHILVPIELKNKKLLWVNRGWVKALPDRRFLPRVEIIPPHWVARGQVYFSKGEPVLFEHALTQHDDHQWVLQGLDYELLSSVVKDRKKDVLPYIIRLSPDSGSGFVREWKVVAMPPEKHIAYAIQWFGLAITLIIIALFLMFKKQESNDGL